MNQRREGFVVVADGVLRFVPTQAFGGPAATRVAGESSPRRQAIQLLAWLAYPSEGEADARLGAMQAMGAWFWRSMLAHREIRPKDAPSWVKGLRRERVLATCDRIGARISTRLDAADMAFWLAMKQAPHVDALVDDQEASVRSLSARISHKRHEWDQTDNVRGRTWYASRPVIHLAVAISEVIAERRTGDASPSNPLNLLLPEPDWVPSATLDIEHLRCTLLPIVGIPAEASIQFLPCEN